MIDVLQLITELQAALGGGVVAGVDSTGRVTWAIKPTPEQEATAETVVRSHDPTTRPRARAQEVQDVRAAMVRITNPATTAAQFRQDVARVLVFLLKEQAQEREAQAVRQAEEAAAREASDKQDLAQ